MTDENNQPQSEDLVSTFRRIAKEKGFDVDKEVADAEIILAVLGALVLSGDVESVYTAPGFRYALFSVVSMALHDEKHRHVCEAFGQDQKLADFLMMLVIDGAKLGIAMGILASTLVTQNEMGKDKASDVN